MKGLSQQNESLNITIGSKVPKIRHYGSSASNDIRVAAAVCQKNAGFTYVPKVLSAMDLSPGIFAMQYASKLDRSVKNIKKDLPYPRTRGSVCFVG